MGSSGDGWRAPADNRLIELRTKQELWFTDRAAEIAR
jgi:hypothetical protein